MTLRGILTAQGNLKGQGAARRPAILLGKTEQDAPARAHSQELNMPLACLLASPALARIPLADLLAHTPGSLTPFRAFSFVCANSLTKKWPQPAFADGGRCR